MTYQETIEWMFKQLPMYQNIGKTAYKGDLTNSLLLDNYLGNPSKNLKCIHVAGTNGKGSTSHLLASILQENGYKVGLYTSPHLKDYRERIKINGKLISKKYIQTFIKEHKDFFEANSLSFFEMTVGLAFDYFSKEIVDIAIIEVGMGGRLDSTNIINPILSIITNIGLDHTAFLGTTHVEIAIEKAGIIKKNIPVVIGEYNNETKQVFCAKAKTENANVYYASEIKDVTLSCPLIGDYQKHNKKTVLQSVNVLKKEKHLLISDNAIKNGFKNVIKNTGLFGRWQIVNKNPKVICDTAHNREGLEIVLNQLKREKFYQLHIVLGVVNDKDLDTILPLFPKNAIYYFCKPNIPRGLDENKLKEEAKQYNLIGESYSSVKEAYRISFVAGKKEDLIYIGGSTFVVAEIL